MEAGYIGAVAGLKSVITGDTLCEQKNPIRLESLDLPEPVISIAIEPKSTIDQDKMSKALEKLENEDPTFRVGYNEETGQIIISGMGELHLEVLTDRLLREFRVAANIGKPQVSYRETISKRAQAEHKYVRETEKLKQYAHVIIEVEPGKKGSILEFENKSTKDQIPHEYIEGIVKGLEEGMGAGVIAGFPMLTIKATLKGGSFDPDNSDANAFKVAASIGFREAVRKAGPTILEPVMSLEVLVPDEYLSNVLTDLNSRRAQVNNVGHRGNIQVVDAIAPLSKMFGYTTGLRSISQGRATYTMEFASYERVSKEMYEMITGRAPLD